MSKTKIKPLKLDEWRKKGAKLKKKYNSYEELKKDCLRCFGKKVYFGFYEHPENDIMTILPHNVLEYVGDERIHLCRDSVIFHIKDGRYEMIDSKKMIDEIVPLLSKNMDKKTIKELMRDVLEDLTPPELLEFYLRAVKLKGSIKPAPGCFKFKIGGKPGAPKEMMIRD
jgi:hypothetical protein